MNKVKPWKPWQAAFVAYCNGMPLEEISQVFNIPEPTLLTRMEMEGWAGLRQKLPVMSLDAGGAPMVRPNSDGLSVDVSAKFKVLEANRQKNLAVFEELRDHLVDTVKKLKAGELKLEKIFNTKGITTRVEVDPGPADWVNISTYARTIADGTYRALGDMGAQEKPGSDAGAGAANPPASPITIILPGPIAKPREERQADAQVIDLRDDTKQ